MRLLNKSLAVIIAVAMLLSCVPMFAFADSVAHNVTISADKITAKAGDTIAISVTLDNNQGTSAVQYKLVIPSAFTADIDNINEDFYADYELEIPACVDYDWFSAHTELGGTKKWGDPVLSGASVSDGVQMTFAGSRSTGITAKNATDNMVIGVYNVTVAENAAPGEYEIYFADGTTTDAGQSFGAAFSYEPLTITVEGEPTVEKVFTVAAPKFDGNVATCVVVNTEDTAKDIILVVAEYKDNELVALNVSDAKSVAAGTESATLTAAYTGAGSSAKAFVLNNLTDCVPYVAAVAK